MEYSQAAKANFFAYLDSLDVSEDEIDNSSQRLEELACKRRRLNPKPPKPSLKKAETLPPQRTSPQQDAPAPLLRATTDIPAKRAEPIPIEDDEPAGRPPIETFRRSGKSRAKNNAPIYAIETVSTNLSNQSSKLLLQGLSFFFIPNNDVHPVRKRRIQSATAQGAKWIRDLKLPITHIIVDPELSAADVAKFLNGAIDVSRKAIVKDKWLIESLSYKTLRDTTQGRFQLQGASDIFPKHEMTASKSPSPAPTLEFASKEHKKNGKTQPQAAKADELSQILHDLQTTKNLPIDDELDLRKFISFESTIDAVAEIDMRENRGFHCMEPHTGQDDNPNSRTIEILQKMATYYDRTGDNWRTLAYRKAMTALRKQPDLVKTAKQAQSIKGIGSRLADKIEEIVTTDRLRRFDETLEDPNDQILQLFTGIYDVGIQQAKLWISQGYQTLDDLKKRAKLTPNQQIGLDRYDDFQQRIPREEVTKHGQIVARALKQVNKDLEGIIGGSYRRGNKDSGDIDVIITHPTADLPQLRVWVFDDVVPRLFEIGFMKGALATNRNRGKPTAKSPGGKRRKGDAPTSSSSDSGSKFHGASALTADSPWRRIDLLLTPHTEMGAALIYFTGNDIFNRSMRLLASRKGMRLNQRGLYKDVMRTKDRTKVTDGELVEGKSEKRIFEILGVPWRPPHERKC